MDNPRFIFEAFNKDIFVLMCNKDLNTPSAISSPDPIHRNFIQRHFGFDTPDFPVTVRIGGYYYDFRTSSEAVRFGGKCLTPKEFRHISENMEENSVLQYFLEGYDKNGLARLLQNKDYYKGVLKKYLNTLTTKDTKDEARRIKNILREERER